MCASDLQNIVNMAAPAGVGVSFDAIICICAVVIMMSVLIIKPLAGGVK